MTKIIAEIGSNWEPGKLESALAMVRLAAECGANLVKFQDWHPVEDFNRPAWWKKQNGFWTLPPEWIRPLKSEGDRVRVRVFTSIFTVSALTRCGLFDPVKIASSEIGNQELLLRVNESLNGRQTLYLSVPSTGMGKLIPALTWLHRCSITPLLCMADEKGEIMYPADNIQDLYLPYLRDYGLPVGLSSHLPYEAAIEQIPKVKDLAAVELHLRSHDTPADCPDNGPWALYPEQFRAVVEALNG